jgi:hypothetical protein
MQTWVSLQLANPHLESMFGVLNWELQPVSASESMVPQFSQLCSVLLVGLGRSKGVFLQTVKEILRWFDPLLLQRCANQRGMLASRSKGSGADDEIMLPEGAEPLDPTEAETAIPIDWDEVWSEEQAALLECFTTSLEPIRLQCARADELGPFSTKDGWPEPPFLKSSHGQELLALQKALLARCADMEQSACSALHLSASHRSYFSRGPPSALLGVHGDPESFRDLDGFAATVQHFLSLCAFCVQMRSPTTLALRLRAWRSLARVVPSLCAELTLEGLELLLQAAAQSGVANDPVLLPHAIQALTAYAIQSSKAAVLVPVSLSPKHTADLAALLLSALGDASWAVRTRLFTSCRELCCAGLGEVLRPLHPLLLDEALASLGVSPTSVEAEGSVYQLSRPVKLQLATWQLVDCLGWAFPNEFADKNASVKILQSGTATLSSPECSLDVSKAVHQVFRPEPPPIFPCSRLRGPSYAMPSCPM